MNMGGMTSASAEGHLLNVHVASNASQCRLVGKAKALKIYGSPLLFFKNATPNQFHKPSRGQNPIPVTCIHPFLWASFWLNW